MVKTLHKFSGMLFGCFLVSSSVFASENWVKISGEVTGPFTIEATIETNIKDEMLLGVDLSLTGLNDEDIAVGAGFFRVPISNGSASVSIDARESVTPHRATLPSGEYDLEVFMYPNWKENKSVAALHSIEDKINHSIPVSLQASGQDRDDFIKMQTDQKWVMLNVNSGSPWDFDFWFEKFGRGQQIDLVNGGNPNILKNYYFESIDMTIKVNVYKEEIVTWVVGRPS